MPIQPRIKDSRLPPLSRRPLTLVGVLLAMLAPLVSFGACDNPASNDTPPIAAREPYRIVCTTGMIGDLVRSVVLGADASTPPDASGAASPTATTPPAPPTTPRATTDVLLGPGVDPHLYKPTRSDIARLTRADIVFYNGLLLEGKMTDTFERLARSGKRVHAVTEHLGEGELLTKAFEPGAEPDPEATKGSDAAHHDPHVWMDPLLWIEAIEVVVKKLSEFDPDARSLYESNAQPLRDRLKALAAYAERSLATIPERSRVLVTAHDAFGYFGKRFKLQVEGIQGISTESEAGVRDIERLVSIIVDRDIKAVFIETSVSDRNIKALVAGAAARGKPVALGGLLFSDAMGEPNTYEGTYVGMIDHNVTLITRALGGQAPERGMLNRLSTPSLPTPSPTP